MIVIIPFFFDNIGLFLKFVLLVVVAALNICIVYFDIRSTPLALDVRELLRLMLDSLYGREYLGHFRTNIMLFDEKKKELAIVDKYSINMEGHPDRFISFDQHTGLCGKAFRDNTTHSEDFRIHKHEEYNVDPGKVWNEMMSLVCVPIRHPETHKSVGVLNVDSDLSIDKTRFNEPKVVIAINEYAHLISRPVLEEA